MKKGGGFGHRSFFVLNLCAQRLFRGQVMCCFCSKLIILFKINAL